MRGAQRVGMESRNEPVRLILLHNDVTDAIPVGDHPVFVGNGDIDYVCGACGATLCRGVRAGDLAGLALRCGCGASSRVPWLLDDGAAQGLA